MAEIQKQKKKEETFYIKALTNSPLTVGLIRLYSLLHPLLGATDRLQWRKVDTGKA